VYSQCISHFVLHYKLYAHRSGVVVDLCKWNMNVYMLLHLSSYDKLDNYTPQKDLCQLRQEALRWEQPELKPPNCCVLENTQQLSPNMAIEVLFAVIVIQTVTSVLVLH